MRLAILTLPLHTNYGGILQAYALQTVLQRMGHEVKVLQKVPDIPVWKKLLNIGKRLLKFIVARTPALLLPSSYRAKQAVARKYFPIQRFIKNHINLMPLTSLTDLNRPECQGIVVGSDQIWRPVYFRAMWKTSLENAFLAFTANWNIKRVAYAASFGTDNASEFDSREIEKCGEALQRFDMVTVREESGVKICEETFKVEAYHVLDPTMLLSAEDYRELIEKAGVPESSGNLFCYILDPTPQKERIIRQATEQRQLTPFQVGKRYKEGIWSDSKVNAPIEEWLRGFMDAELIITDSFHACVFSIIFNKPFIAIGNTERGLSRFTSLLSMFGLLNNLITEADKPDFEKISAPTSETHRTLESLRKESIQLLQKGLN